jgi:magnesium transporter
MLHVFGPTGAHLMAPGDDISQEDAFVWIDCFQPTREEERLVETTLGLEIPSRQEMLEIEISNRLHEEGAVQYLTTNLLSRADSVSPEVGPVTFILTSHHLVTLRYNEYMPFRTFIADFQRNPALYTTADRIMAGIIDKISERMADVLEKVGFEIETLSADLFKRQEGHTAAKITPRQKDVNLRDLIRRVGLSGNLVSKIRETLVGIQRVITFLNDTRTANWTNDARILLTSNKADIGALSDHSTFLANKISFLLDATLGLINMEQNDIIRIFSIAAVMFMPPTLVASVYGMNFHTMPELGWQFGYEYALLLIFLSAIVPYIFFKRKGWL